MSTTEEVALATARDRSPLLGKLEKLVFERCLETGDSAEAALLNDPDVHVKLMLAVKDRIDHAKVQQKLETSAVWLKKRLAIERQNWVRGDV